MYNKFLLYYGGGGEHNIAKIFIKKITLNALI